MEDSYNEPLSYYPYPGNSCSDACLPLSSHSGRSYKKANQPSEVPSRWYQKKRTAMPGNGNSLSRDQIMVCLETDDVDSAQLESASFTVYSDQYNFLFPSFYNFNLFRSFRIYGSDAMLIYSGFTFSFFSRTGNPIRRPGHSRHKQTGRE